MLLLYCIYTSHLYFRMRPLFRATLLLLFVLATTQLSAQSFFPKTDGTNSPRHQFYLYWGYNRCGFLKSDLHLHGPKYDFTLYNITAYDRPTGFSPEEYFSLERISIPQYNYRFGYYITDHIGISIGLDHMKYVLENGQMGDVSGTISPEASTKYAGTYNHTPVLLASDFVRFEHTDGLNLVSIDAEYIQTVASVWHNRLRLSVQGGAGAGPVIPRTESYVFNDGLNNYFHLAGWGVDAKAGVRLDLMRHFFLMAEARGGFISLPDILLHNYEPQRADQNIVFGLWAIVGGWKF